MNKRMRQVTLMLSAISGVSIEQSYKLILSTDTGKAIENNNPCVLYEQQTENLYIIGLELHQIGEDWIADKITPQEISKIVYELPKLESEFIKQSARKIVITNSIGIKRNAKMKNKQMQKKLLKRKKQNLINAGRVK